MTMLAHVPGASVRGAIEGAGASQTRPGSLTDRILSLIQESTNEEVQVEASRLMACGFASGDVS